MRTRLLPVVLGVMGLVLMTPVLVVMGFVVATERATTLPSGPGTVEGVVTSPDRARGPIGAPFVFGRVRIYASYRRGGRMPIGSVSYVDEERGDPRVMLSTASGPVAVLLKDPMNTWRNATPEQQSYDAPGQVPGWQPSWRLPSNLRTIGAYVLAVRSGQTLLVERAADGVASLVWVGGRSAGEAALRSHSSAQRSFSIGSFVAAGLCALASVLLLALAALRRSGSS